MRWKTSECFLIQCFQLSICDSCFNCPFFFHTPLSPFEFPTSPLKAVTFLFVASPFGLWSIRTFTYSSQGYFCIQGPSRPSIPIFKMHTDLSFTCNMHRVYLRFENEATIHNCLGTLCYPNGSWFYSVLCKLGHRCFIAVECFETISYVQWEKKPLKIHAEIIKLFNFTVKLSEQVMNLSLYCLPLHTWLLPLWATESAFPMLLSTPHGGVWFSKVSFLSWMSVLFLKAGTCCSSGSWHGDQRIYEHSSLPLFPFRPRTIISVSLP